MTALEIQQKVQATISAVLNCNVDATNSRANTENWDSLKNIEIVFSLEDAFGVSFTEKQLTQLDSVANISELIFNIKNES